MVFTAGASEGEDNTVGGLIVFPGAKTARYFAARVPDELIADWREELKHVIGPVELYAAVVARKIWHARMSGRFCLHFTDNVPSQDSLVKWNSTSEIMRSLLVAYERLESHGQSWTWFARVPSDSNPADEPSRGRKKGVIKTLRAVEDKCDCPVLGKALIRL